MHTWIHAYMHTCIHPYMHAYIHTFIHTYTITLHYITLRYVTLRYVTLRYVTLRYIHTFMHACMHTYVIVYVYCVVLLAIMVSLKRCRKQGVPSRLCLMFCGRRRWKLGTNRRWSRVQRHASGVVMCHGRVMSWYPCETGAIAFRHQAVERENPGEFKRETFVVWKFGPCFLQIIQYIYIYYIYIYNFLPHVHQMFLPRWYLTVCPGLREVPENVLTRTMTRYENVICSW